MLKKEQLEETYHKAVESSFGFDLHLMFLDLNNFKQVNDTYGHNVGDQVLAEFERTLDECLRKNDSSIRYGGDEFVVFLPNCNEKCTKEILNKIAQKVATNPLLTKHNVGVSIGCSLYKNGRHSTSKAFIEDADKLMYLAKKSPETNFILYSREPESIDYKLTLEEHSKTLRQLLNKEKYIYILKVIKRMNNTFRQDLLIKAMNKLWEEHSKDLFDHCEFSLCAAINEYYREEYTNLKSLEKKQEMGLLDKASADKLMNAGVDYTLQKRKEIEEDSKKMDVLNRTLEVAKELEEIQRMKEIKNMKEEIKIKENNLKAEQLKTRLEEAKKKKEEERLQWTRVAAERKRKEAEQLLKQAQELEESNG